LGGFAFGDKVIILCIYSPYTQPQTPPVATQTASSHIVGSSGSILLHFAEADEHINVVRTLLLHRPMLIESIYMTPEMLAGIQATAEVLREWLITIGF
jgi:hypothetical protein